MLDHKSSCWTSMKGVQTVASGTSRPHRCSQYIGEAADQHAGKECRIPELVFLCGRFRCFMTRIRQGLRLTVFEDASRPFRGEMQVRKTC
jgi:hypothetical protein